MTKYLLRRVLISIPLLLLISMMLFLVVWLQPSHPWDLLLARPTVTAADRARILAYYGFDQPLWTQYLIWLQHAVRLDFDQSYFSHQPTMTLIGERLPNTLILMATGYIMALVIAIPIGIIAAVKRYSAFDNFVTSAAFLGISLPSFWFGLMLIMLLAVLPYEHLGFIIFPTGSMFSDGKQGNILDLGWHLVLPAFVLAVQFIAQYSRFVRASMLEVLNQDYIRTARAKGVTERRVILKHGFRNALLPLITQWGYDIPQLFVGALITEQVFKWPGMGRLFWDAARKSDYQVLMGILVILAVLVVVGNLFADLAYSRADPRIRY